MQITFIIPCYNAENIIIKNYKKLTSFIKKYKIKSKIIYVNDGSVDDTYKRLKEIKNNNVQILSNSKNLGKSRSIINAIRKVKTNYIVLIDCDLPYFTYLKKIIKYLKNYDLIVVNRKLKKSANIDINQNLYKITRNLISNLLGKLIENKLKLNVNGDTQAGLKAFKINNFSGFYLLLTF